MVDWLSTAPGGPLFVAVLLAALALVPRGGQAQTDAIPLPLAMLVGVLPLARSPC